MIKTWLYCCAIMVVLMIAIGGLTRLSDAGLSIVEWKPVTGIIPPLSSSDWHGEFSKYQSSPEYKAINSGMSLQEFKHIFWLEFIHRFAARLTGLVICLPLLFFYLSGKLPFRNNKSYMLLPILLLAQGVMGWYMVKSGLLHDPHVSHFRLAAHMMLAVALYSLIINRLLSKPISADDLYALAVLESSCTRVHSGSALRFSFKSSTINEFGEKSNKISQSSMPIARHDTLACITLILIYLQIFLGALVAGLDAGLIYNTFPLMGGQLIPVELYNSPNLFSDPASVQFMHRFMAYVVTASCLMLAYEKKSFVIALALLLQVATGIITLLYNVPVPAALLHQFGAVVLLTAVLFL